MSTMTLNQSSDYSKVIDLQLLQTVPSGIHLNRRGRLARTFVVLSLAIVAASVAGGQAGAQTSKAPVASTQFITVTVAPGDTVWSLANRLAGGGDVRSLVSEIISVNSLASVDVATGQKLRIPLQ